MRLDQLYATRRQDWQKVTLRYTKLVANSGAMFSLYVALIIGGVYYQKALKVLPPHFPSALILTVLFVAFVFPTTIRTYVQRADLIFLLPAESELESYFRQAIRDSWIRQAIILIFVAAVGMPLYLHTLDPLPSHYGIVVLLFILLKGWNIFGVWAEMRLSSVKANTSIRFLLSLFLIYFILIKASWIVLGLLLLVLLVFSLIVYRPILINEPLNWNALADQESRQAMRFLRLANWVTDVPGLVQPIKPRRYMNFIQSIWKKKADNLYFLLYLKTFFRAGDYFGLYARLTVIGAVLLVMVRASVLISCIIFGLSLFLTVFQLLSLGRHDFPLALEGLYPVGNKEKRQGFLRVMRYLMIGQSFILSIVFLIMTHLIVPFLCMLVIGAVLAIIWIYVISFRQVKSL